MNPTGTEIRERIMKEIDKAALTCLISPTKVNAYANNKTLKRMTDGFIGVSTPIRLTLTTRLNVVVTILQCDSLPDNMVDFGNFLCYNTYIRPTNEKYTV